MESKVAYMKKIDIDKLSQFRFLHELLHDDIDKEINLLDKHLKFMYETSENKETFLDSVNKHISSAKSSFCMNMCLTLPNAELSSFDFLGDMLYFEGNRSSMIDPNNLPLASRRIHSMPLSHMHTIASKYVLLDMLNDYKYLLNSYKNSNLILVDNLSDKIEINDEKIMNLLRFRIRDGFKLIVYVDKFITNNGLPNKCLNGVNFIVDIKDDMLNVCSFYTYLDKGISKSDRTHMTLLREKCSYNVYDLLNNNLYDKFDCYGNMFSIKLGYNILFNLLLLYLDSQNQRYVDRNYKEGRSNIKNQNRIKIKDNLTANIHIYDYKLSNVKYVWEDGKRKSVKSTSNNKKCNRDRIGAGTEKAPHRRKSHTRVYNSEKSINVKEAVIHKDKMDGFSVAHKVKL